MRFAAGNFIQRIATGGPLNAPWGLTLAPMGFGSFGGDLLVGNLFNSTIDAFNLGTIDSVPEPDYLGLFVPGIAGLLINRLRRG